MECTYYWRVQVIGSGRYPSLVNHCPIMSIAWFIALHHLLVSPVHAQRASFAPFNDLMSASHRFWISCADRDLKYKLPGRSNLRPNARPKRGSRCSYGAQVRNQPHLLFLGKGKSSLLRIQTLHTKQRKVVQVCGAPSTSTVIDLATSVSDDGSESFFLSLP